MIKLWPTDVAGIDKELRFLRETLPAASNSETINALINVLIKQGYIQQGIPGSQPDHIEVMQVGNQIIQQIGPFQIGMSLECAHDLGTSLLSCSQKNQINPPVLPRMH